MTTIDIKLKTYEQLQFEITTLNTKIFLKDKEIERLNNIINRGIELLEPFVEIDMCVINGKMIKPALDKLKELKEGK